MTRFERDSRGWAARCLVVPLCVVLLMGLIFFSSGAHADSFSWRPMADVREVSVVVDVVSQKQIIETARKHGMSGTELKYIKGFAVLSRTKSGELHCRVLVRSLRDRVTLGHEMLHCLGWAH